MADVVVVGAGICGSAAAMMLARDGHSVTVLDRDPGPIPASVDDAWNEWSRRSVGQFRLAHIMLSRGTSILKSALPEVTALLAAEGGLKMNAIDAFIEASGQGGREPADDRFDMLTGRRTTIEWVLATVMDNEPNVTVRRGVVASGLLTGAEVAAGTPHVAGVRLDSGEELAADLVIDATGRNSPTPRWLEAIGARAPIEHSEDSGFAYYGRFFQSDDGSVPKLVARC